MTTITINTDVNSLLMDLLNSSSMNKIFRFELNKVKTQDKEDVKQECIIRIMKALKTQEIDEDKITSFCQTIIKRTVVDYYRKINRKIEQSTTLVFFSDCNGDGVGSMDGAEFAVQSEDYNYDLSDVRADFEINRHRFTPTEQEAVEFILYNTESIAMNIADVAKELQINKSHTTRAMQKLREIYLT